MSVFDELSHLDMRAISYLRLSTSSLFSGTGINEAYIVARDAARGRRAHHKCSVEM